MIAIGIERGLKLGSIVLSALLSVGAALWNYPDLSGTSWSVASSVLAGAALGWMLMRGARLPGSGVLAGVSQQERRPVRRARHHPDQVPEKLTPLALR